MLFGVSNIQEICEYRVSRISKFQRLNSQHCSRVRFHHQNIIIFSYLEVRLDYAIRVIFIVTIFFLNKIIYKKFLIK